MTKKYDYKFNEYEAPLNKWVEISPNESVMIEGVGKDAEIVTNEKGGKQSNAPMAIHLIDPIFLKAYFESNDYDIIIDFLTQFMLNGDKKILLDVIKNLAETNNKDAILEIARVLKEGAEKYEPNNWRLIPQEEHINHALIHYAAYIMGDTQDDHLWHCLTRLMMAYATETSPNFSYTKYISKEKQAEEEFYDRL